MTKAKKDIKEVWDSIPIDTSLDKEVSESLWKNIDYQIDKKDRLKNKRKKTTLLFIPMLLLGIWFGLFYVKYETDQIYETTSYRDTIRLKDGSQVYLEPYSKLVVLKDFNSQDREVRFMGKGYFDIAKNIKKPFRITSPDFQVEVLGTKFNLYNTKSDQRVELFEGKVKINKKERTTLLLPNEAWKSTNIHEDNHYNLPSAKLKFSFNKNMLEDVIKQLEASYQIKIKYPDSVKNKIISGAVKGDLKDILQIVAYPLSLKPIKINDNQYILK